MAKAVASPPMPPPTIAIFMFSSLLCVEPRAAAVPCGRPVGRDPGCIAHTGNQ
jgi:hypothetical protein